jgi:poly-gamma-glutamate capsule biosynthesis protein CapA/YwtB (metallophosphatase superfamily)
MRLLIAGDVNLMGVTDPAVPFARVRERFRAADLSFLNLECSLHIPTGHSVENEGFFVDPDVGTAVLEGVRVGAVGLANNVTYGEVPIAATLERLKRCGIVQTGAGANRAAARAPAIVERDGVRVGFLQRTSVYWPTNHEAAKSAAGVAVIRGHTAYRVRMHKERPEIPPLNRPGIPPEVITWADPAYLRDFSDDVAALRKEVDIVVVACHWGLWKEVLGYMTEIAHAAIDAGADIVVGHGPHFFLPIEMYRGKPILYGLGSFSFHTGHGGRRHGDWVGLMAEFDVQSKNLTGAKVRFVRHNDVNETVPSVLAAESEAFEEITRTSAALGATLAPDGDDLRINLNGVSAEPN